MSPKIYRLFSTILNARGSFQFIDTYDTNDTTGKYETATNRKGEYSQYVEVLEPQG